MDNRTRIWEYNTRGYFCNSRPISNHPKITSWLALLPSHSSMASVSLSVPRIINGVPISSCKSPRNHPRRIPVFSLQPLHTSSSSTDISCSGRRGGGGRALVAHAVKDELVIQSPNSDPALDSETSPPPPPSPSSKLVLVVGGTGGVGMYALPPLLFKSLLNCPTFYMSI